MMLKVVTEAKEAGNVTQGEVGNESFLNNAQEDSRRASSQYTIKGIPRETVDLTRSAARKEGMKVGAWVSMRLREAADRALAREGQVHNEIQGLREFIENSKLQRQKDAETVLKLEKEVFSISQSLYEITKCQNAILTKLLSR
jgi:hypothetical protein